jgi:hypothetical protein
LEDLESPKWALCEMLEASQEYLACFPLLLVIPVTFPRRLNSYFSAKEAKALREAERERLKRPLKE